MRGAKCFVVGAPLGKADLSIRAAPYLIRIVAILTIIFPATHGTYLESCARVERLIAAAWASQWKISHFFHVA